MEMAVEQIWSDFQHELKGFVLKKVKSQSDADDIMQDVFFKIIQNQDKLRQANNLKHYLYGMVRNAVFDFFRVQKNGFSHESIVDDFTVDEAEDLYKTLSICCVKPFINQLPEKYRSALTLVEMHGISQKDFAEKYNISYSAAKSRVQRGREKLKDLIVSCCAKEKEQRGEAAFYNCDC